MPTAVWAHAFEQFAAQPLEDEEKRRSDAYATNPDACSSLRESFALYRLLDADLAASLRLGTRSCHEAMAASIASARTASQSIPKERAASAAPPASPAMRSCDEALPSRTSIRA